MMHSEFTDPLISPSSHESRHTGVDLANLRLEEEEVPNAVSFDAGADNPAEAKHLQVFEELARLGVQLGGSVPGSAEAWGQTMLIPYPPLHSG